MLVASVTAPFWPAPEMISASASLFLAFQDAVGHPSLIQHLAQSVRSFSIDTVPSKTG